MIMQEIIKRLKGKFTISDEAIKRPDLAFITIEKAWAVDLVDHLKRKEGFTHLVLLTAVDWIEEGNFQLTYLLNNPNDMADIGVRVLISRENATMESMHHMWATISTYQRELKEMYGIDFPDSPRVDVPFILEGWKTTPPMRREFDTKEYSERTYFPRPGRKTHDPATYMKEKMYPDKKGESNV
jgi:NADH-quinone oxidoreductase subunit C